MLSFKEHAKKFNLDDEEQEILADFEANHAGKPQITENRRKELAALANASYKLRTCRLHGVQARSQARLQDRQSAWANDR